MISIQRIAFIDSGSVKISFQRCSPKAWLMSLLMKIMSFSEQTLSPFCSLMMQEILVLRIFSEIISTFIT